MDILVCMKLISVRRFADQIPSDSPAGRLKNGDLTANPADLTALEAALRLRDAEGSGRVTVMAMAPAAAEPVLRRCLAMGADAFVTGEVRHHDALAACAQGLCVIEAGHAATEHPAISQLAGALQNAADAV